MSERKIVICAVLIVVVAIIGIAYAIQKLEQKEKIISSLEKDLKTPYIGGVEGVLINAPTLKGEMSLRFSVRNPAESNTTFWYVLDFWPSTGNADIKISGGVYALLGGSGKVIDTRQEINRRIHISNNQQLIIIRDDFVSPQGEEFHETHDVEIDLKVFPIAALHNTSAVNVHFYQGSEPPAGLSGNKNPDVYTDFQ